MEDTGIAGRLQGLYTHCQHGMEWKSSVNGKIT
jgi:hypothetical protein